MLQMQVQGACFPWLFFSKTFSQEEEMDFHRNAHGKSRLKHFPVSGSLFVLVVSRSLVDRLHLMPAIKIDNTTLHLGALLGILGFWLLMVVSRGVFALVSAFPSGH